jgi:hypothetical protein
VATPREGSKCVWKTSFRVKLRQTILPQGAASHLCPLSFRDYRLVFPFVAWEPISALKYTKREPMKLPANDHSLLLDHRLNNTPVFLYEMVWPRQQQEQQEDHEQADVVHQCQALGQFVVR